MEFKRKQSAIDKELRLSKLSKLSILLENRDLKCVLGWHLWERSADQARKSMSLVFGK